MASFSYDEAMDELEGAFRRALSAANRNEQNAYLAGEFSGALANLEGVLIEMRKDVAEVIHHQHEWDYGDTESDPVRCVICGADGLA